MNSSLDRITRRTNRHETRLQFQAGFRQLRKSKSKIAILSIFVLAVISLWLAWFIMPSQDGLLMYIIRIFILSFVLPLIAVSGTISIIVRFGKHSTATETSDKLYQIGLVNHADQTPTPITDYKHETNRRVLVETFLSNGTDIPTWRDKKLAIEKIFDRHVIRIDEKQNSKEEIIMYSVPASSAFPQNLKWHDSELSNETFELVLGENLLGRETVNLARMPHLILGGASGSGKTIMLKSMLMQCVKKGADVYIADFKGGVDFPYHWRDKCTIITLETDLLEILTNITDELERRKVLLSNKSCADIDKYNAKGGELKRIIFACDEIAEITDKTGISKERKALVEQIEAHLSTIARLGRAFGIHLIISTQRPDHTVISGQIRSNIPYRICGRANKNLSEVILENTDAADQIPSDAQGRFITSDGVVFQGYMIYEDDLIL